MIPQYSLDELHAAVLRSDARVWRTIREAASFGVWLMLGPTPENDDLVQETAVAVVQSLASLRDSQKLRSWVIGIAKHKALDHRRKRSAQQPALGHAYTEPTADAASPDVAAELKSVLSELPEEQRLPLLLFDGLGWTRDEVAEALNIPAGTVASRIREGKQKLQEQHREDLSAMLRSVIVVPSVTIDPKSIAGSPAEAAGSRARVGAKAGHWVTIAVAVGLVAAFATRLCAEGPSVVALPQSTALPAEPVVKLAMVPSATMLAPSYRERAPKPSPAPSSYDDAKADGRARPASSATALHLSTDRTWQNLAKWFDWPKPMFSNLAEPPADWFVGISRIIVYDGGALEVHALTLGLPTAADWFCDGATEWDVTLVECHNASTDVIFLGWREEVGEDRSLRGDSWEAKGDKLAPLAAWTFFDACTPCRTDGGEGSSPNWYVYDDGSAADDYSTICATRRTAEFCRGLGTWSFPDAVPNEKRSTRPRLKR